MINAHDLCNSEPILAEKLDGNHFQTAGEHILVLGLATFCEIVVWITAIFHVFFSLKANENPLAVIPLIPREERTGAAFSIADVISVSASDKIGDSALGTRIKIKEIEKCQVKFLLILREIL